MSASGQSIFFVKIAEFFPTDLAKKLFNEYTNHLFTEYAEENAQEICAKAVKQWLALLLFVNLATRTHPVVLGEMLMPVGNTNSFSRKLAEKFATWSEILDRVYCDTYGNNSEQGQQLAQTFASNLCAEIDSVGKLQVSEGLVITKSGNRYILEKDNSEN